MAERQGLKISYEELHHQSITDADVTDIAALQEDLTKRKHEVTKGALMIAAMRHRIIIARVYPDDPKRRPRIVGMGCIVIIDSPFTGRSALVTDVVVTRKRGLRGRGIGRTINLILENRAKELRAKGMWLTSGSQRTEAHGLYKSLDFRPNTDTTVFEKDI